MCCIAHNVSVDTGILEEVARARWFLLASTVSVQRLAAHLPGLVCPYRQAGLCKVAKGSLRRRLIHRSAWKGYSPKFRCRMLHRTPPGGREDGFPGYSLRSSGDYM